VPSYSTIQRALQAVNAQELEAKLVEWARTVEQAVGGTDWEGIAMDGNRLLGSETASHRAFDVLNAFSHRLGIVLGQRLVGNKTNEIPELIPLLAELTLTGRLVTVAALPTQRETAQTIVKKGGLI
jgi:hypothetical protein